MAGSLTPSGVSCPGSLKDRFDDVDDYVTAEWQQVSPPNLLE
ncbi:hypothetical protein [Desulfobacula sp.]|nr:hypothetical protein [Desulfobacula sp.]